MPKASEEFRFKDKKRNDGNQVDNNTNNLCIEHNWLTVRPNNDKTHTHTDAQNAPKNRTENDRDFPFSPALIIYSAANDEKKKKGNCLNLC